MLRDVLEAAAAHGDRVRLVTDDAAAARVAAELGVEVVADPGGGQGAAVAGGARSASTGVCLVVNADLPRVRAVRSRGARGARAGRCARASWPRPTARRTRSALPFAEVFRPLYGPGSAARFRAHAAALGLDRPRPRAAEPRRRRRRRRRCRRRGPRTARSRCSARERRPPLRRRRRRQARGRAPRRARARRADRSSATSATTSRCSACTSRPTSTRCSTPSPGLNDTERGWGRAGETWQALESARAWGGEGWFMLGDLDLGLHLVRSQALRGGRAALGGHGRGSTRAAGLATRLLPATDDRLRTHVVTPQGTFAFQEWFVARRHEDEVDALVYEGADASRPAPGRPRGDRRGRRDRDRPEQPVRLDPPDPRRARHPGGARGAGACAASRSAR